MNDSFNAQAAAQKTRDSYRKNVAEFEQLARNTEVPEAMRALAEKNISVMHWYQQRQPLGQQRDYGDKTRIDMNQSYQVAYWKERFGVSEEELSEAVRVVGALARRVEAHMKSKDAR